MRYARRAPQDPIHYRMANALVLVAPGLLAITKYQVHLNGGTGRYSSATGDLSFIGEIDFNNGHAVLRYSGNICSTGN